MKKTIGYGRTQRGALLRLKTALGSIAASRASEEGLSLVEIVIAVGISMVISVAIYAVYINFYRQTTTQEIVLESQQNAKIGMSIMERELQNAGNSAGTADIITDAAPYLVEFLYTDPTGSGISATSNKLLKVRYIVCDPTDVAYEAVTTYAALVSAGKCSSGATTSTVKRTQTIMTSATIADGSQPVETAEFVPNVKYFKIKYYNAVGAEIASTVAQADRNTIRYVNIAMTVESAKLAPGDTTKKTFLLETQIHLRNIEMGQTVLDTAAPDAPINVKVRDSGRCGRLKVSFTKSAAGDVAGYKIYYGTDSSGTSFVGVIDFALSVMNGSNYSCALSGSDYQCTIFPTTPALAYTPSTSATPVLYYIAVKAYDTSFNHSPISMMAYGDASTGDISTSNTDFSVATQDSSINPTKPGAVTGFNGAPSLAADGKTGQVTLTWSAYNTTAYPDVTRLRIYRSNTDFTTYPIDPTKLIATVTSDQTSYVDTSTSLIGCTMYYYAIAPVNCDTDLITNNGGVDPASKYYGSASYAKTYGDGAKDGGFAADYPTPGVSNTTPPDLSAPPAPELNKTSTNQIPAGYKRTFINFKTPGVQDFDHSDVYYSTSAIPTVDTNPVSPDYGKIFGGVPIPDTNDVSKGVKGRFYGINQSIAITHDTEGSIEDVNAINIPQLGNFMYYYLVVSYDKCGNPSSPASGTATAPATLCGDGTAVPPPDPEVGPPSQPLSLTVSGCYPSETIEGNGILTPIPTNPGPGVTLSWTAVQSDASTNPDLAKYRLYRMPTSTFNTNLDPVSVTRPFSIIDCSVNPTVTCELGDVSVGSMTTWTDNAFVNDNPDTRLWSYGIVATDCVFEDRYLLQQGANPDDYKNNNSRWTNPNFPLLTYGWKVNNGAGDLGVALGYITRDKKIDDTLTAHNEVLTGVVIANDSATGASATGASSIGSYDHDSVTLFLQNTANGRQKITGLTVDWVNSGANLASVSIGGGSTASQGSKTTNAVTVASNTVLTGDPVFTRSATVAVTPLTINANKRHIPLTLVFQDAAGSPIDMRGDQLRFTINITNETTNTTTCKSYATYNKLQEPILVPQGPSITTVVQNKPTSPTSAYAVPGVTGSNTIPTDGTTFGSVKVNGGAAVTVAATILANTDEEGGGKVPISSVKLYYQETAMTVGAPASTGWTAVDVTINSGTTWQYTIPAMVTTASARRMWYYMEAFDSDGNFERAPAKAAGYYTYDQTKFDPCIVTPMQPTLNLSGAVDSYVYFYWPRVTKYTDGSTIDENSDPITYWVYRKDYRNNTDQRVGVFGMNTSKYQAWDGWRSVTSDTPVATLVAPATTSYHYVYTVSGVPTYFYWLDYYPVSPSLNSVTNNDYEYYVRAKNSCGETIVPYNPANTLNLSVESGRVRECFGSSGGAVMTVTPSTATNPATPITSGTSYTVTISDCSLGAVPNDTTRSALNVTSVSTLSGNTYTKSFMETTNTSGLFTETLLASYFKIDGTDFGVGVKTAATNTANDSVTISCPACSGPPAPITIYVTADSCQNPPTQVAASSAVAASTKERGRTGSTSYASCSSNYSTGGSNERGVTVSWTAPAAANNIKDPITGYNVYRRVGLTGTWTRIANSCATTDTSYGDRPNTTANLYYYVVARDACGNESSPATGTSAAPVGVTVLGPFNP